MIRKTKIMMVNIRGLPSKTNSLSCIIEEEEPTIVILMETLTNEEPDIPGYRCKVMETRDNGWGGIMVLAKVEISNLIQIKREQRNEAEMLFLQVTCGRSLMTIGIIYAPQENQVDRHKLDNIYQIMRKGIVKDCGRGYKKISIQQRNL